MLNHKKSLLLLISFFIFIQMLHIQGNPIQTDQTRINSFSTNLLLSATDRSYPQHVEPTLAISEEGILFAGWKNAETHNGGGIRVSFSKSTDGGANWTPPANMPHFEGRSTAQSDPWLVWANETLYYAYLEFVTDYFYQNGGNFSQITVAQSENYGDTWTTVAGTNGTGFADKETLTVSSDGILYIAYDDVDLISGVTTVRVTRSDDGGATFNETGIIANSINQPYDHVAPYITTDSNNNVYIAWFWYTEGFWGDIYLTASTDQGVSFSSPIDVNNDAENATFEGIESPTKGSIPVLRFDQNDRLYVLAAERLEIDRGWDVYLRYSDDYGTSWSPRYQINPEPGTGHQWMGDMDIDSQGRIHIVWYSEIEDEYRPYYRMITFPEEGEPIYGSTIPIASETTSSTFTRPGDYCTLRLDSAGVPHVVWTDGRFGEMDIYYAHGIYNEPSSTPTSAFFLTFLPLGIFVLNRRKKTKQG